MITTTSELSSHCPSAPGATPANEAPIAPAHTRQERTDEERHGEDDADVDAERADHCLVVDPGTDDEAHPRLG